MRKTLKWVFAICLVGVLTACGSETTGSDNEKMIITTTTGQIADIAINVAGDLAEVESLMGPGIDPHSYQASQGDISKLDEADIIFYNGLHLEGKMDTIFEKMSKDKPTVAVADALPTSLLLDDQENASEIDPHIWFDPSKWVYAVEEVRDQLVELDPDHADTYKENAEKYLKEIEALIAYGEEEFAKIPEESRVLVTAHDAFQYFGEAFGFEVMGLQGISTDSEYGLRDVQDLVDVLVDRNIKAVFVESSVSDRSITAVVEGAGEKDHTVVIGGELYSDAMGEQGTEEGTYVGMFKHNIETIVSSLK
ncbi:metal ABC transporter solute-binding protein, Zn/Mn family [Bacillus suaedae]|uniref:Zinc ABC transporter substrate-binding protein n=1 Tax=Halalkalibacter suaedae TaxID=2822140 RepID=A0A941APZ9_9BACI|nr:zinc ABC transporter substrate-binding protein [Bacillus suaedae]MBP3953335.1 zinc ABC transporter substrate-binding protein [Bacillus suaedae]